MSRRIRLDLAYDGSGYAGWQVQPGQTTIQSILEDCLSRLNGNRSVAVRGAGRTDAGVHARAQVCDFKFDAATSDAALVHALHRMLPAAIQPLALRTVEESFHPRRNAIDKQYRYRLDRSPYGDPREARFALHYPFPMERESLERALERLPGRRDWSGFTASACEVEDRLRTLTRADFETDAERGHFLFEGDGFLTHMVRNLVGTLLEISRGKMAVERIDEILRSGDRRLAGPTAAARGLHLWRVRFPDDPA